MKRKTIKIELTGNPFVDTGLGVIGALAKLDDINYLTLANLKSVYGDGSQLTEWNSKLKAFTQIFGTNNPLYQPSYGYKKGKGPSDTNKRIYKSILKGLLAEIGKSGSGPKCWACGCSSDFDFAWVCKKAVEDNGKKMTEYKWVGRDWFPLAGSLGSDAQALPAASRAPHICPKCLFAIHYLPLGLILIERQLVVFQCTSIGFWYGLVQAIVDDIKVRVHSGNYETLGKKERSRAVVVRLLSWLERLQRKKLYGNVPEGTALYMWRFSNSGASPECFIEEIPNPALIFLWDVVQEGLRSDIESLVGFEGKNSRYSLFRCIIDRRDYLNLYPEGKRKGASQKLFAFYQMNIRRRSAKSLQIAHKLAKEMVEQVSAKELRRIQRPEAFKEEKVRIQFRASMVQMAERGEFTLGDYLDLFPIKEGGGIKVEWDGWNLIRFFLHHVNEGFPKIKEKLQITDRVPKQLHYYAGQIYNHYISEKGENRFRKEVLAKMGRDIGINWLRNQFIKLAESEDGFTYGHWLKLCKLDGGKDFVSELLFQIRLLWSQWVYENRVSVDIPTLTTNVESTDGLSVKLKALIEILFTNYVCNRGLVRFHRDILIRLRRGEIGLFWFKEKLTKQAFNQVEPITDEEWEELLVDDEGQSIKAERLFQLHIAFANLYRIKKFKEVMG